MSQILIGVLIGVISAYIVSWLGINNSKTTLYIKGSGKVTKTWKVLILTGTLMFFGGGYYTLAWASISGLSNPKALLGILFFIIGLLFLELENLVLGGTDIV